MSRFLRILAMHIAYTSCAHPVHTIGHINAATIIAAVAKKPMPQIAERQGRQP
jgi:hypothetical protein